MPRFEVMNLDEARMKSATGKRAQITREYLNYIDQLGMGQAGKLEVTEGEKVGAVRRRLGVAAKLANKDVTIKRVGNEIFFWVREGDRPQGQRRRGRPRKNQNAA